MHIRDANEYLRFVRGAHLDKVCSIFEVWMRVLVKEKKSKRNQDGADMEEV